MGMRRVVVTGMGAVSPFGRGADALLEGLMANQSGVRLHPELAKIKGLRTRVAGLVSGVDPKEIPRKFRRSMSEMSIFAALSGQEAVDMGGISAEICAAGRIGIAMGSTVSSPLATDECYRLYLNGYTVEEIKGTLFFQLMNHSCASNMAQLLGITGRILALSSACSTGNQAIGYGYELIAFGKQDLMLCGGTEEFHPLSAATFDIINAGSIKYNDRPQQTPRPFDQERDGMVCAEGCGVLLLEALDSALQRQIPILAEVIGFATGSDPANIADPHADSIESCLRQALSQAGIQAGEVDYINAHATGTLQGDKAEAEALRKIFGDGVPVSSLKGHLGHTLAASGALESIATIGMMNRGCLIPTLNLKNIDPLCGGITHLRHLEDREIDIAIKNNFALGGINSCTVFRRYIHDR
ncbi:MAG: beta-ketoacyl-[acyl-carrier-protein] synthase family protein [Thermodesulfobacteriota bacterium]